MPSLIGFCIFVQLFTSLQYNFFFLHFTIILLENQLKMIYQVIILYKCTVTISLVDLFYTF